MPTAENVHPGSTAWLEARAGMWTGSRAAELMTNGQGREKAELPGKTAEAYAFEMAAERLTGVPTPRIKTKAMQRGLELEPDALDAYAIATGMSAERSEWIVHPDHPTVGATTDGGFVGADGLVEIKCPEIQAKHLAQIVMANGGPPSAKAAAVEYEMQAQWQLWVSGRIWIDVTSYHPDFPPHLQVAIVRLTPDWPLHRRFAERVEWAEAFASEALAAVPNAEA